MTDLTKAFDFFLHDLIIANLEAYDFLISAKKLIHVYLSNRKQGIKVNDTYSSWKDMFYDVPQRSIVGPLLNIYSWKLFYFLEDLNIVSHTIKKKTVINALQTFSSLPFGWFNNNFMKVNSDKSNVWWLTKMIDGLPIDSSKIEKINNKL